MTACCRRFTNVLRLVDLEEFTMEEDGTIFFRGHLCVPQKSEVKMDILREAHHTLFMVHSGETKMYQDVRQSFWWKHMKVDIAKYVASCGICQKVKAEHKRPARLLKLRNHVVSILI
jgi:hypothetical protein